MGAKQWVSGLNAGGGTALAQATLVSVNRPVDTERANIAFIVSDGAPTVGQTNWDIIQEDTLVANERSDGLGQKWAVFNIGVGSGAPISEITKLSTQNMGLARQIFDHENVVALFAGFMEEYATPLIWNQKFQYNNVDNFDCSSTNLYADQEMVCIGQVASDCDAAQCLDLVMVCSWLMASISLVVLMPVLSNHLDARFWTKSHVPQDQTVFHSSPKINAI